MRDTDARREIWIMVGIAAGWVFVLVVFWTTGVLDVLKGRAGPRVEGKVHFNPEDDPKVGSVVSLPGRDLFGRDIKEAMKKGKNLVVYGGSCTGCSMKVFDYRRIAPSSYGSVILVFWDKESVVKEKLGSLAKEFYMVVDDERGTLREFLNAVYTPRFYLVDEDSRLVDYQRYADKDPDFVKWREVPVSPSSKEVQK